jgi:hypothetical protein
LANLPSTNGAAIAGIGDYNQDGIDDLLLQHQGGWAGIWIGGGQTRETSFGPRSDYVPVSWLSLGDLNGATIRGGGDFNGDGLDDILLQHPSNTWAGLCLSDSNGVGANWVALASTGGATITGIADYNRDGFDDLVLQHPTQGWSGIWSMGDGGIPTTFSALTLSAGSRVV